MPCVISQQNKIPPGGGGGPRWRHQCRVVHNNNNNNNNNNNKYSLAYLYIRIIHYTPHTFGMWCPAAVGVRAKSRCVITGVHCRLAVQAVCVRGYKKRSDHHPHFPAFTE